MFQSPSGQRDGRQSDGDGPRPCEIGLRYPVDQLAEAFAEGIVTARPAMPEFVLSQEENRDLIAYLKSIQSSTGS